jgi:hypothetical protein
MDSAAVAAKAAALGARTLAASSSLTLTFRAPAGEAGSAALPASVVSQKSGGRKKSKKHKASVDSERPSEVLPSGNSFLISAAAQQVNKQALDDALLVNFRRHIIENPFVPGHCFFEALAISAELTKGAGTCLGAF